MSNAPEHDDDNGDELPGLDFHSPGRFAIHNPSSAPLESAPRLEPAPFVLGQHERIEECGGPEQLRNHALALTQQARRSLCLYTPDLEPWLYDQRGIAQACARFLRAHPRNRLRILLRDSRRAVGDGHALLRLARQYTSNCLIRKLSPEQPDDDLAFLLADDCGLLLRPAPLLPSGQAHYKNAARVRQLQRQFDNAWDNSCDDPELRSFLL